MGGPLALYRPPGGEGLEQSNATVRWTVAADGLTEANLYLLPLGADANESLTVYRAALLRYIIKVHPTVVASVANRTPALYNMCILQEGELVWIS